MTAELTPRMVEMVGRMNDGRWWRVSRDVNGRWQECGINPSIARRLVDLGLAEVDVQHSLDRNCPRVTFVRLNAVGLGWASEIVRGSR